MSDPIEDKFHHLRCTWRLYESNRRVYSLCRLLLSLRAISLEDFSDIRVRGWDINPADSGYKHIMCRLPELAVATDTATPSPRLGLADAES